MAKLTVLDIVQDILSTMDSDSVNSISDTVESLQVANIVRSTYRNIITTRDWPHLKTLMQLTASGAASLPTHMSLPENVMEILWIKYNKRQSSDTLDYYSDVYYLEPKEFMDLVMTRDSSDADVSTITDPSGVSLLIRTDAAPTYWTSFDDEYLVFDAYDSAVDSTLQGSKTQVEAYREPTFTLDDGHIPDLPAEAFPYLLEEARSVAHYTLKQAANEKAEQQSKRNKRWLARKKWRAAGGIKYPNYGRK